LEGVIGIGCLPQDPVAGSANRRRMAANQFRKRFLVAMPSESGQQYRIRRRFLRQYDGPHFRLLGGFGSARNKEAQRCIGASRIFPGNCKELRDGLVPISLVSEATSQTVDFQDWWC
jgi:hypothetical protein